jgi:hypothetical protein
MFPCHSPQDLCVDNPRKNGKRYQVLVPHACNPSYSGDRDQKDRNSKPTQANSLRDPISKYPITKKDLVEWLKV